jgi:serine/threonine-protein kinase HipA
MSIEVRLWDIPIGAIGYGGAQKEIATFEFFSDFPIEAIQISPLTMKTPERVFSFPDISHRTFRGVPGIFADSLPDKFGNQLIDEYMATKGIAKGEITALDRLAYIGERGMGAITYHPNIQLNDNTGAFDINQLSELASLVLCNKEEFRRTLLSTNKHEEVIALIRIGSSAGGARAKALVATDGQGKFYDGTITHKGDYKYWLIKFDTENNSDRDGKDPKGMTRIEYIYSLFARKLGIDIPHTSYFEVGEDFHFLIERFDRVALDSGEVMKLHYASWSALEHADRDTTGAYSYEQLALTIREMGLKQNALNQLFMRAVFNVVGVNHDDHTKNFGFLMNQNGEWRFSPAFDMTYSYDPTGKWTKSHQIKLNQKQIGFTRDDLIAFANYCDIKTVKANRVIDNTIAEFKAFDAQADKYGVDAELKETITKQLLIAL